jgi:hypothetical protein
VRPRRLSGVVVRPLNFTVRRRLAEPVPKLGPFARAFVAVNRIFGAFTLASGLFLLGVCAWRLLRGTTHWSQSYVVVLFGVVLVFVGIVYLRSPLWRRSREAVGDASSQGR